MMEGEIISVLDNTVIVVTEKKENVVMRKGALELIEG